MNNSNVVVLLTLLRKDIRLFNRQSSFYVLIGLCALAMMAVIPGLISGFAGTVILLTALVAAYCHMIMNTIVFEKKEKTLRFLMTLPITPKVYLQSKFLSNIFLFLCLWSSLYFATLIFIYFNTDYPAVSFAWYSAIFAIYPPAFLLLLTVALISQSEGWTILTLVLTNVLTTVWVNIIPQLPGMKAGFEQGSQKDVGIIWPEVINYAIAFELGTAILIALFLVSFISLARTKF